MITISPFEGDAKAFEDTVDKLLDAHAEAVGLPFNAQNVHLTATDQDGTFLGGLTGYSQLGWLFIQYLALAPEGRGKGVGRELMQRAEAIARERNLSGIWVDTYEFQAPEFYAKLGYTEYGRLPKVGDHPSRIWFYKVLKEGDIHTKIQNSPAWLRLYNAILTFDPKIDYSKLTPDDQLS